MSTWHRCCWCGVYHQDSETTACPVCGDTYADLWGHLTDNVKGCGTEVLKAANNYSVKLESDSE